MPPTIQVDVSLTISFTFGPEFEFEVVEIEARKVGAKPAETNC